MTDEVISRVIESCRAAGLDGACLVGVDAAPPMDRVTAMAGGLAIFFGVEISLARGRLVWIPSDPAMLRGELPIGRPMEEVISFFKEKGGVMFAAHPYDRSDGQTFMDSIYDLDDISGIEVANAGRDPWRNNMAQEAASQLRLKGFGGTGRREPGPGEIGAAATLILEDVTSQAELVRQLGVDDCWALEFLSDPSQFGEEEGEQEVHSGSHDRVRQPRPQGGREQSGAGRRDNRGRPDGHQGRGNGRGRQGGGQGRGGQPHPGGDSRGPGGR